MTIKIQKAQVDGQIQAIPSKSYAHRISICNFLAGKQSYLDCGQFCSKDIEATLNCLTALAKDQKVLDCGESGSTLRFMIPLCAVIGGEREFVGQGRLMARPNDQLFSALKDHGVTAVQTDKIVMQGKANGGQYFIRGDVSSQYISGLLMALPMLNEDSEIVLTTPLSSAPYVDITLQVLSAYGVNIQKTDKGFYIKGNQKYRGQLNAEGDWSNAAFFLTLGAISGSVKVSGLNMDSVQGDKKILDVLRSAGALVEVEGDSVTVKKSKLDSFVLDAEDCPDLVPIASVIGAFSDGMTVITNVERLKIKESDRIQSTIATLNAFGITASTDGHALAIYGGKTKPCLINSFNDHRIVMAGAVLASATDGESIIEQAEAVNKSYPNFFEHLKTVGGKVSEV